VYGESAAESPPAGTAQVAWPDDKVGALVVVQPTVPPMCPVIVNVAVPVGVPDPELPGATVAVKVTPWLSTEGLACLLYTSRCV